jgi:O-antigen ligase
MQMGDVEKVSHWIMSPYYNDHTAYGAVLAFFVCITAGMMFLPALTKKQRFLSSILMIIMLIGLFLSFSRAAWLSLIVAVGVGMLLFFKVKIKTVLIAFATMLVLLFTFQSLLLHQINKNEQESSTDFYEHIQSITNISSDASNVERINRWSSAVSMFKERPVFGFGPGTYQFQYAPFQRSKYRTIITTNSGDGGNAHSEYLGPLSESGILGTLSVIFLVITVFYSGINIYRKEKDKNIRIISLMCVLALTTYYTHGFLNNFLDTDKLAVPVFGAMAVIVALDVYRKNQSNISSNDEK